LFLKEIAQSNSWEKNIEAIVEARNRVLNQYQLFPFLHHHISQLEANKKEGAIAAKKNVFIKGKDAYFDNYPLGVAIEKEFCKLKRKIIGKVNNL
jgi:hypothetical protein